MAVSTFTQFLLHNEYASLSELEEGSQATPAETSTGQAAGFRN
jgi:hypothetical protein